ncbi:MAG: succinylglutamate desuccinylase/aspartoacylase family protein [Bacteroidota bacterium]
MRNRTVDTDLERKIGERSHGLHGPLLIVVGQMHGNEPAGSLAVQALLRMIDWEFRKNPSFHYRGKLVGLRGNLGAIEAGERYVKQDLNRIWKPNLLSKILTEPVDALRAEEKEARALHEAIRYEIDSYDPSYVFLLDIHTTTATGGIFLIPPPDSLALEVAKSLHAPIVKGMIGALKGTLVEYAETNPWGVPTDALVFEAGQHHAPVSVDNSISAIVGTMRALGMLDVEDVEHAHDDKLQAWSRDLPKMTRLVYRHSILPEDGFHMLPGFKNFVSVEKGQLLAHDRKGPIHAPESGFILMPLYQRQGEDGFFLLSDG